MERDRSENWSNGRRKGPVSDVTGARGDDDDEEWGRGRRRAPPSPARREVGEMRPGKERSFACKRLRPQQSRSLSLVEDEKGKGREFHLAFRRESHSRPFVLPLRVAHLLAALSPGENRGREEPGERARERAVRGSLSRERHLPRRGKRREARPPRRWGRSQAPSSSSSCGSFFPRRSPGRRSRRSPRAAGVPLSRVRAPFPEPAMKADGGQSERERASSEGRKAQGFPPYVVCGFPSGCRRRGKVPFFEVATGLKGGGDSRAKRLRANKSHD